MLTRLRHHTLGVLVLSLLAVPMFGQQRPWDGPAFAAEPKALIAAAQGVEAKDFATVTLLDEAEYVVGEGGGVRARDRVMVYVVAEAGVEWQSEVRAPWAPWFSERPTIEARVVTRDGTVHILDQGAVVEVPAGEEGDIFSDGRVLRAPLPAVAVGSVIEYVISRQSKDPIPGAGSAVQYFFGDWVPTERTRVTIDAPLTFTPRIVNRSGVEPRVEEKDGRRRTVFEAGRIEGEREVERNLPYDVATFRYLAFSTGKSWQDIATSYAAIVDRQIANNDRQIANSDLQKMVHAAVGNATDRKEIVARLLAAIQKDVRYAGVEIGEGSIVPRTPKQVLANKYGDCKDKAALLVAMLRLAGIPAHVALLNAGTGFDVLPELPGLGDFNHAIAVVDGAPAVWIDPTDVFARAGELPLGDQGRLALIADPATVALTRTPETESAAHLYRELRTFVLPEEGKGRVTEISQPSGSTEASLRRWISGLDAKALREQLEGYAKSAYVAKTLTAYETSPANDLTGPFQLKLDVPESGSSMVSQGEASVIINLASLPQTVPDTLRDWKEAQPGESPDDAPKKRTRDFLFPEPSVREWVYRIVPPAGYVPRTLPVNETKKIGTTTFTQELHTEPDQTVVATFRFDSGKRRLNVAEFQETRVAFTKFVTDNTVTIGFEQLGQTKLNAGDVRGALDEFRRLAAKHPKEAQHHLETARALLAGGLGDAAREEARKAVAIEPKNARAHQMLGTILQHDSLGRIYRKGFDLNGSIAEFRKAKELDPDDYAIRYGLIRVLSFGDDGYRFGHGAHLDQAVEEVKATVRDLGDEGKGMHSELTVLYSHLGRFADVRTLAPTLDDDQQRNLARIIATAALDGADAAVRELGAFNTQTKRSYASGVSQMMLQLRLYPQAAALLDLSVQGTASAADSRGYIEMLKKLKRVEDKPREDGPRGLFGVIFTALLHQDTATILKLMPPEYAGDETLLGGMAKMDMRPPDEISVPVFGDLLATMIEVQQDGDEATGYRLRMRPMAGMDSSDLFSLFVRREGGQWLLRGSGAHEMTGDTVMTMAEKGELEAGRTWLNWAREEAKGGTSDDPLEGSPMAVLWPKGKATATVEEIRVAAASLATDRFGWARSEPILIEARERAAEPARNAIDVALLTIYRGRKDWPRMLAVTTRLAASSPDSATAFAAHVEALLRNGKAADAKALAEQRLQRLTNDPDAVRALARVAAEAGDYAAAQQYATRVVEELRPKRADFTRAAWLALFTGQQFERALEHAQTAVKDKEKEKTGIHSSIALAALYAETGRSLEARTALLAEIDDNHRAELEDADWYILGRIAENYGVDDFAIAAYKKVGKGEGDGASVTELAQRRLAGLKKK